MTDREKLSIHIAIDIIKKYLESSKFDSPDSWEKGWMAGVEDTIHELSYSLDRGYQPTGKACYDKPPGVPIYHCETEK